MAGEYEVSAMMALFTTWPESVLHAMGNSREPVIREVKIVKQ